MCDNQKCGKGKCCKHFEKAAEKTTDEKPKKCCKVKKTTPKEADKPTAP